MHLRSLVTDVFETLIEGGETLPVPLRVAVVSAVIRNPWAERGFVADLNPGIAETAPELGALLAPRVIKALGLPAEAYGKAAIVGLHGDIEHGSGLIHTLDFGDHLRTRIGATTLLPAVEKRAPAGATFDIPMKHITDPTTRSHHQSVEVRLADAPHPDEIVVSLALSSGGRPHARLTPYAPRP